MVSPRLHSSCPPFGCNPCCKIAVGWHGKTCPLSTVWRRQLVARRADVALFVGARVPAPRRVPAMLLHRAGCGCRPQSDVDMAAEEGSCRGLARRSPLGASRSVAADTQWRADRVGSLAWRGLEGVVGLSRPRLSRLEAVVYSRVVGCGCRVPMAVGVLPVCADYLHGWGQMPLAYSWSAS